MAHLHFTRQLARYLHVPTVNWWKRVARAAAGAVVWRRLRRARHPQHLRRPARQRQGAGGVSCGGGWQTLDGGASRALSATGMRADYMLPELDENDAVQGPHRIVRSAGTPDARWHWDEVTMAPLSHFGFAVAVHPRDGGKTFEVLRAGLPQQHCYDLVYRHGLALADDGRSLLMASTTGGAWYSSDEGEHWQMLSAHLPPVYAVCFSTP